MSDDDFLSSEGEDYGLNMRWSPNLEEDISRSSGLRPTFEHYDHREDSGYSTLQATIVNDDVYENQHEKVDERAKLTSYRRKVGLINKNTERRQCDEQQEDSVEFDITKIMRTAGLERESLNYRPNSKTTFKSAIPTDKLPVTGVNNLYLLPNHFKFPNPYFISGKNPESTKKSFDINNAITEINSPSIDGESIIGVTGEQYVTPAQLYASKTRHNRFPFLRHKREISEIRKIATLLFVG